MRRPKLDGRAGVGRFVSGRCVAGRFGSGRCVAGWVRRCRTSIARERPARGQSLTVLAVVIMAALIMTAGLVIDGGQKAAAVSRAESIAAAAARAGADAGATESVAGHSDSGAAVTAANAYLRDSPGVRGTARIVDGQISVHTEITIDTLFLSVIGVDHLTGTGDATSRLYGTGQG